MILATYEFSAPVDIAGWLAIAFFVVALLNAALKLADRLKDKPAASEVRAEASDKFVAKSDYLAALAKNDQEHKDIWGKLGGMERGVGSRLDALRSEMAANKDAILEAGQERSDKITAASDATATHIHDRINDVLSAVSELRGTVHQLAKDQAAKTK